MNPLLDRPRSFQSYIAGLGYLGLAALLLWMGLQRPDIVVPQDLETLLARSGVDRQRAEAMIKLAEENGRLGKVLLAATTGGDANAISQIQQSLKANGDALEKLAGDSQRQADETKRLTEERGKNQASRINRQHWITGIAVSLLMFLAYQACLGGDRPRMDQGRPADPVPGEPPRTRRGGSMVLEQESSD